MVFTKRLHVLIGLFVSLFVSSLALADVIIPSIWQKQGLYSFQSWALIFIMLFVKFLCFLYLAKGQVWKVFKVTILMNIMSAAIGTLLVFIIFGIPFKAITQGDYLNEILQYINNILHWGIITGSVIVMSITIFLDVLIEGLVFIFFFPEISKKSVLLWLILAHVLSTIIELLGIGI